MAFKIGDRVEVIHDLSVAYTNGARLFIGKKGVIVSELEQAPQIDGDLPYRKSHQVEFESGRVRHFIPQCLRRIDVNPDWIKLCYLNEVPVDATPCHVDHVVEFS